MRRSARRRTTVSAFYEGNRIVVAVPARLTAAQEQEWVRTMVARLQRSRRRRRPSDADLVSRCRELSREYLDGGAVPTSVAWVTNQNSRWGSCTPATGEIRISHRLRGVPAWVLDYVLVHELTHLLVAGHGPRFHAFVDRYPHTERAKAFLEGISFAMTHKADEQD